MNNQKKLSISNPVLTESQIEELARPLVAIVRKFYENPKNEEDFQKWLQARTNKEDNK